MAELFLKQAEIYSKARPSYLAEFYSKARPSYPDELFRFIASKTPIHDLVWDVGTGNGQAAISLSEIYKNVIATDISQKQLEFATKRPNIRYECTLPEMPLAELEGKVAKQSSLDLVTIAQAMHWFDLPTFYRKVKWALKKPHGVIAAWCYTLPEVGIKFDSIFRPFYNDVCEPYFDPVRKFVDNKYMDIEFDFEPVDGTDSTGPFEFVTQRAMDLDGFLTYVKTWSAYHTAKEKGVELLTDEVVQRFKDAWDEDDNGQKIVKIPIYLRIGKVGNLN